MELKKYNVKIGQFEVEIDEEGVLSVSDGGRSVFNKESEKRLQESIQVRSDNKNISIYINEKKIAGINKSTEEVKIASISNFSLKNLLYTNNPSEVKITSKDERYKPKTDIHTHLGGVLDSGECISLLLKHKTKLPEKITSKIGANKNSIVSELDINQLQKLHLMFSIPIDKQSTFMELEEIYDNRAFINKDINMFKDILHAMGKKYQDEGVQYAEVSFSSITDPEYLKIVNEEMPKIQDENGVTMTFMAGIWRHSNQAWIDYEVDKLKNAIHNPYVVGLDVMGHETNSILEIRESLVEMAKEIKEVDKDFNLRIHAGENKVHPENVFESLSIAEEAGVPCRIGHGLYGFDEKSLNLAKKNKYIVEFNLHSNLSLNNISGSFDDINRIIDKGIPFVFSSDGGGIYNGSAFDSLSAANLTKSQVSTLKRVESSYIQSKISQIERKKENNQALDIPVALDQDKYIKQSDELEEEDKLKRNALEEQTKNKGIKILTDTDLKSILDEKIITVFSGASKNSWPKLNRENQENIVGFLRESISTMGKDDVIFTGGTDHGVEKYVHKIAQHYGITVVGALTEDANPAEITENTINSAVIIKGGWYDKHANVLDAIKSAKDKKMVFIGGGDIVATEIQSLVNHNTVADKKDSIPMYLMDLNGEGASSIELKDYPELGFKNNEEYKKLNGENNMKPIKYQENEGIMKLFDSAPEYMKSAKTLGAVPNERNVSEVFGNLKNYTDGMELGEDERVIPDENGVEKVVKKDCVLDTYVLNSNGDVVIEKSNLITNNVVIASNVEPVTVSESGEKIVNSWLVQKNAWIKNYGKLPDSEENKPYQKIATMKAITITPEVLYQLGSKDGKSAKIHIDYDNGEMEVFLGGKLSDQGYGITKEEFSKTYAPVAKKPTIDNSEFDDWYDKNGASTGAKKKTGSKPTSSKPK